MQQSLFEREVATQDTMRPLRPRQLAAIAGIREAIREGHRRIVVQLPTGGGKTVIAAHIIASALSKSKRAMFVCPAINLVNQTLKSFESQGIRSVGVIQANHERTDWSQPVQIASVQTLIRRSMPEVNLVIIDEVHQNFDGLNEILDSEAWTTKVVIGLSASPWTKGMGLRWTKLIVAGTTSEMIEEGWLCPFTVFAPEHSPDLSAVKVVKGEYDEAQLVDALSEKEIVADVVKTWLERGPGRKTFLYAVNRQHARLLQEQFEDAGVRCGYMDGMSTPEERLETFRQYDADEIKIIASVGTLIVGVDKIVLCLIVAVAIARSEIKWVQLFGRGLRINPDGSPKTLIVLDHGGNSLRLGLPTDIHHDTLDTRLPKDRGEAYVDDDKPAKPLQCKTCRTLIPPGSRACPQCKERVPLNPGVVVKDGRLVEMRPMSKAERFTRQRVYSELLGIARKNQHKDGWAAFRFKDVFGVMPTGLKVRAASVPSDEVKAFVAEQRKAYKEARKVQA
jgi:DNA repair protein RadD